MDVTARWAQEDCEFNEQYQAPAYVLFDSCKAYAKKYENYDLTMTEFGRAMGKKYKRIRINSVTYYLGLRIRNKTQLELDEDKKSAYKSIDFNIEDI